jgi:hypothetical protein
MKSIAVALLLNSAAASKVSPDVYGPNGVAYVNNSPHPDLARIGVDITTAGTGKKCKAGDWTTIHYKGYLKDGRKVTSTKEEKNGLPVTFALGNHETFACFDVALTQLQQGTVANIHCPYDLAWGNAFTWAPVGGEPIPLHSDIDFVVEVQECNRLPGTDAFSALYRDQPVSTTLQPSECFYLHLEESDNHTFEPLVLTCNDSDVCTID